METVTGVVETAPRCGVDESGCTVMAAAEVPVLDVRHDDVGDVVVASWIAHSALAIGRAVYVDAGSGRDVATLLGVPDRYIGAPTAPAHTLRPGIGDAEYRPGDTAPVTRFDSWCEHLGLPALEPVRPPYAERRADGDWADDQWRRVDPGGTRLRVLVCPQAAQVTRVWPKAYFIDIANDLAQRGCAVATMAATQDAVSDVPCHRWSGLTARQSAALCHRADLVIGNDAGPVHLASAVGTATIAICGPTDPDAVFGHEPNIRPIRIDPRHLACVGCHFQTDRGYRHACGAGGCQALMCLDPATASAEIQKAIAAFHLEPERRLTA